MFTGIVREVGTVVSVTRAGGVHRLSVLAPKTAAGLSVGESVAINGVCLSVVQAGAGRLEFEMIPETRRLTNLAKLSAGSRVNVEPSLSLSDRINGHLVLGHVDGVGRIVKQQRQAGQIRLTMAGGGAWRGYLVPKGPVTVDGVSLTVGDRVTGNTFSVFLIPETIEKTTLGARRTGDLVNIEVDYAAKLVAQLVRHR